MANKRQFKKNAEAFGAVLCENMLISWYNVEGADRKAISDAIGEMLDGVEKASCRANVRFDRGIRAFNGDRKAYGKARREFFKAAFLSIHKDFQALVDDVMKRYNAALPAAEKEANKATVAK